MAREPYAAINASLMWHRKVSAVPEDDRLGVIGWYTAVSAYCELNRTDGYISYERLAAVGPFSESSRKKYTSLAITVHLFDEGDGGIRVHSWLVFNKSKEEIETGRKGMSDGGKKSGETRRKKSTKVASEPTIGRFQEKSGAESAEEEEALSLDPDPELEAGEHVPALGMPSDDEPF